jgi:hypothetical protein
MSKRSYQKRLLTDWVLAIYLPDGRARWIWRTSLVFLFLLNLVLFFTLQSETAGAFFVELVQAHEIVPFPAIVKDELTVFLYGPSILTEVAQGRIELHVRNDSPYPLNDLQMALVSPKGAIRVEGGTSLPNTFQVENLPPGSYCTHTFKIIGLFGTEQAMTQTLDLNFSYSREISSTSNLTTEVREYHPNAYIFQLSHFTKAHRALRQALNISQGGATTLDEWRTVLTALFAAIGGFVTALFIHPAGWFKHLYDRLYKWIKGYHTVSNEPLADKPSSDEIGRNDD